MKRVVLMLMVAAAMTAGCITTGSKKCCGTCSGAKKTECSKAAVCDKRKACDKKKACPADCKKACCSEKKCCGTCKKK